MMEEKAHKANMGVPGAFFFLIFILTTGDFPVAKTISDDPATPYVTINGVVFHAQTFGDPGNPVVLVVHSLHIKGPDD